MSNQPQPTSAKTGDTRSDNPTSRLHYHGYSLLVRSGSQFQSFILLVMRLAWGWELWLSGWRHLHHVPDMIKRFTDWGVPVPALSVHVSGMTELIGGLLIMLGLGTRLVALPLIFNFIVAYATASKEKLHQFFSGPDRLSGLESLINDDAFPFLMLTIALLAFGPGKASVDYLLQRVFRTGKAVAVVGDDAAWQVTSDTSVSRSPFARFQFWAAIGLIAGFFMPWFSLGGIAPLPGYQVSDMMRQQARRAVEDAHQLTNNSPIPFYMTQEQHAADAQKAQAAAQVAPVKTVVSYMLYAIPLLGALCMILEFRGSRSAGKQVAYFITGVLALGSIAVLFWLENDDGKLLQRASIGVWLTAAGGVVIALGALWPSANSGPTGGQLPGPLLEANE